MGNRQIYIVEDETILVADLKRMLTEMGATICGTSATGEKAVEEVLQEKPDLILMDINLKGAIDGIEATRQIHEHENIPVVFLTAYADVTTIEKAKEVGPFGYVTKPISRQALHSAIEIALHQYHIEQQLTETNRLLSSLLDNVDDVIGLLDTDFTIINYNKAGYILLGTTPEELIGKKCYELRDRNAPCDQCAVQKVYSTLQPATVKMYNEKLGRYFESKAFPIFDDKGKLVNVVEQLRDITSDVMAEKALREREEQYRELFNNMSSGVLVCNAHETENRFTIRDMNKAATQITGLSKEEVNNRYLSDVFPGITTCGLFDLLLKVWRTGTADHLPVTLYEDEHLSLWVENYVYKLPTGQIVVVFDDVTKRIEMEKKSEEQQQKLVQADKLASIGTLATGVAHEINNPNQSILSNTSFLKHAWDEIIPILDEYYEENGDFLIRGLEYSVIRDEMEGYHSIIEECSKRINTIVQDLKEFARYDPDWEMEAVDMNVILHAAITLTTNFIKKSTNNFELAYGDNLPKVWGNAQKLEQVIINIIQNGCQALPDKGKRLRVRTYIDSTDHTVVTEVTDEGTGISEKHLSKIKDPFFTTKRTRGTGLGLSVSHSIIEEHGGELVFDSEEGKGTKVQLRLPAYHPSSR